MATILVIDDSLTDQKELSNILKKYKHQVLFSNNGTEGVATALKEQPDLILMDIVMPELNGFQATRQISKNSQTTHIPIILISSKDQETDKQWGLRQGAVSYLTKPVNEKLLMTEVEKLLHA